MAVACSVHVAYPIPISRDVFNLYLSINNDAMALSKGWIAADGAKTADFDRA